MKGILQVNQILVVILSIDIVICEYTCLCNYNVELIIYQQSSVDSQQVGYMYEFDCKPLVKDIKVPGWFVIAYQNQMGFVEDAPNTDVQLCVGSIPKQDMLTTTPSTSTLTTTPTTTIDMTSSTLPTTTADMTSSTSRTTTTGITPSSIPTTTREITSTSIPTTTTEMTPSSIPTTTREITSTSMPTTTTEMTPSLIQTTTREMTSVSIPTTTTGITSSTKPTTTTEMTSSSIPTTTTGMRSSSIPTKITEMTEIFASTTTVEKTLSTESITTTQMTSSTLPTTITKVTQSATHADTTTKQATSPSRTTTEITQSSTTSHMTSSTTSSTTSKMTTPATMVSPHYLQTSTEQKSTTIFTTVPSTSGTTTQVTTMTEGTDVCPLNVMTSSKINGTTIVRSDNVCYEVSQNLTSWAYAEKYCKQNGGHLIHIASKNEQDFIYNYLASIKSHTVWIGLYRLYNESNFKWISGDTVTYTNWMQNRPPSSRIVNCVYITPSGEWKDTNCDATGYHHGFVCQYGSSIMSPSTVTPSSITTPIVSTSSATAPEPLHGTDLCPKEVIDSSRKSGTTLAQYGNYCYEVSQSLTWWLKAETQCIQNGGHLAYIVNQNEQDFIYNYLSSIHSHTVWIGLHDRNDEAKFEWTSGDTDLCPEYVRHIVNQENSTLGYFNGSCWALVSTPMTWPHADGVCHSRYGDLATITSPEEQNFIFNFLSRYTNRTRAWIGLNDINNEGHFRWSSGSHSQYTNWDPNHSGNQRGENDEDCVTMNLSLNGVWDDIPCGNFAGNTDHGWKCPSLCQYSM
ncbi:mannose binding [Mactra antiquata]